MATTLYTYDDASGDHNINNAANYFNEDTQQRSAVVPDSDDAVEYHAITGDYFGNLQLYRWQFGTLGAGGTITADFADEMRIKGQLFVTDGASLVADGGSITAAALTGGIIRAENGGAIQVTNSIHQEGDPIAIVAAGGSITVGGDVLANAIFGASLSIGSVSVSGADGLLDVAGDIYTTSISCTAGTLEADELILTSTDTSGVFSGGTVDVRAINWTAPAQTTSINQGGFEILDGAKLLVGTSLAFGDLAGVWHDNIVKGTGAKLDVTGTLTLGGAGRGDMRVQNGASQNWGIVYIGRDDGGHGDLKISNTSGPSANTEITTVTAQFMTLGEADTATGRITVAGIYDKLLVTDTLAVGNNGTGEVTIMGGGTVQAATIILGQASGSQGTITLMTPGSGSSNLIATTLQVGGDGTTGFGNLYVNSACSVKATNLQVESHGGVSILGTGKLDAAHIAVEAGGGIAGNITLGSASNTFVNKGSVSGAVHLGSGNDNFTGTGGSKANVFGDAGNDTLTGGSLADIFTGGAGRDIMKGGAGADRFDFNHWNETGKAASSRDRISDFSHSQRDKIDLRGVDSITSKAGDQNFKFLGVAGFTKHAGELHYKFEGSVRTIVEGDVNGDGRADFQIELTGHKVLVSGDFIL